MTDSFSRLRDLNNQFVFFMLLNIESLLLQQVPDGADDIDTELLSNTFARQCDRECCKGDDASQWVNGKFDPFHAKTPHPIITKCRTRDYVQDIYPHAKFGHDRSRGFFSPYARNCASNMFTRLLFLSGFFQQPTAQDLDRFSRVIRQTTRFRARMCLLRVRKQKFNIYNFKASYSPKTAIFGPALTGKKTFTLQWGMLL